MNRRWICGDVWMDIFPLFDRLELGLNLALLSDRFDALRTIEIRKDKGSTSKLCAGWNAVPFPFPDRPLPIKIRFKNLRIDYIDHSVIEFLRANKHIWDRSGTNLKMWSYKTEDEQPIWDVLTSEIWPIFSASIHHLGIADVDHLDNLRRRTSPTILTDLDQLNSIETTDLFPDIIADDGPNATACQMLSKWLHTPNKNGQPKRLRCRYYLNPPNLEWVNYFKEAFLRAISSVSYIIRIDHVETMPTELFESVNEWTKEKLTLEKVSRYDDVVHWLLKRCPISEKAAAIKWENDEKLDGNLNYVKFDFWRGNRSSG